MDPLQDFTFHQKAGRPKTYKTDEERHEARLAAKRKWYAEKGRERIAEYNQRYYDKHSNEQLQRVYENQMRKKMDELRRIKKERVYDHRHGGSSKHHHSRHHSKHRHSRHHSRHRHHSKRHSKHHSRGGSRHRHHSRHHSRKHRSRHHSRKHHSRHHRGGSRHKHHSKHRHHSRHSSKKHHKKK